MSLALAETVDNIEAQVSKSTVTPPKAHINWCLVLLYSIMTATGLIGFPLLQRVYFTHGGSSKWLSSLLASVGAPILIPPLSFLYIRSLPAHKPVFLMDTTLTLSSACIGLLFGISNFLYSAGLSSIPASTSSLLLSTQLAFNTVFAFIIVRQKIGLYSLNSIALVTCGIVVLALHTSGDQPLGESREKYYLGFLFTLAGAASQGLGFPLIELAYNKSTSPMNYSRVMQFQCMMNLFSALFSIAGMLISKDYKIMLKEADGFGLGTEKYYIILIATATIAQLTSLGIMGVISCTSSLFAGFLSTAALPLTEVASVIAFGEKFSGEKGLSLFLCIWGFASYFIGEYRKSDQSESTDEVISINEVKDTRTDALPKSSLS